MRASLVVTLIATTSKLVAALTTPAVVVRRGIIVGSNDEDGVYTATLGPDGLYTNHTLLARAGELDDQAFSPSLRGGAYSKRALPDHDSRRPYCDSDTSLDQKSISDAEHDLANKCEGDRLTCRESPIWAVSGDVVVYMCPSDQNPCVPDELFEAGQILNAECGLGKVGWLDIFLWKKAYGRGPRAVEFCGIRL